MAILVLSTAEICLDRTETALLVLSAGEICLDRTEMA